jgi:hypothetical protein
MRLLFVAILLAAVCIAERLPPVDDSASDPSFLSFKVRLIAALQRNDVKAVQAMSSPGARAKITPAALTAISGAVRLGVARDGSDFIAPYVFVNFPRELDAYTHAAAIRPTVKVRAKPGAAAPVIDTLDYDIVVLTGAPANGWVEIRTPSDKTGWVLRTEVRTQLEPRVFFEKQNGAWRLTDFVSGD